MRKNCLLFIKFFILILFFNPILQVHANYKSIFKKTVSIRAVKENLTTSYGSGVFISQNGQTLVAGHVVTMGTVITVRDSNGTNYPAMILDIDEGLDLALLSITDSENHPITVEEYARFSNKRVRINDLLETVGNPYQLDFSYDKFRVSKIRPYILNYSNWIIYNAIQVNKNLSPGFSGAGCFNRDGELVGIISLTAQRGNISFLIPISEIKKFLK